MLHVFALFSAFSVIASGLYVLTHGDWHKFGLKFAGVSLSTTAAMWLLGADLILGGNIISCPAGMQSSTCMTFELYHVIRNTAFIIFHIAIGRDAIQFKHRDRRGAQCPKNLKQSPLS